MNRAKLSNEFVQVFLMGDGVNCAVADQKTPNGYYPFCWKLFFHQRAWCSSAKPISPSMRISSPSSATAVPR